MRPGADERAHGELRHTRRPRRRDEQLELGRGVVVPPASIQSLGPSERALEPAALVGRNAVREEARVDAEPRREPLDGLARRPGLAALDLRDVLLREALAGELALGQPGGDPQLTEPLTDPKAARSGGASCA